MWGSGIELRSSGLGSKHLYPMSCVTGSCSFYDPCAPGKYSVTEPHSQGLTKLTKLALSFLSLYLSLLGSWGTGLGYQGQSMQPCPSTHRPDIIWFLHGIREASEFVPKHKRAVFPKFLAPRDRTSLRNSIFANAI